MFRFNPLAVLVVGALSASLTACSSSSGPRTAQRTTTTSVGQGPGAELARVLCGGLRGLDTATDAVIELFEQIEADSVDRRGLRQSLVAYVRGAGEAAHEGSQYIVAQARARNNVERAYLENVAREITNQGTQLETWGALVATFPIDDRDIWEDTWHSWRDNAFLPHVETVHARTSALVAATPLGASVVSAARALDDCAGATFTGDGAPSNQK